MQGWPPSPPWACAPAAPPPHQQATSNNNSNNHHKLLVVLHPTKKRRQTISNNSEVVKKTVSALSLNLNVKYISAMQNLDANNERQTHTSSRYRLLNIFRSIWQLISLIFSSSPSSLVYSNNPNLTIQVLSSYKKSEIDLTRCRLPHANRSMASDFADELAELEQLRKVVNLYIFFFKLVQLIFFF